MTPSEKAAEFVALHMMSGRPLITSSPHVFKPGDRIDGLKGGYVDDDGSFRIAPILQPFAVVREASYEEWVASWPDEVPRKRSGIEAPLGWHFYEVTTD